MVCNCYKGLVELEILEILGINLGMCLENLILV